MSRNVKMVGLHLLGWALFFSLILGFLNNSPEVLTATYLLEPAFLLFVFVYIALFYLNSYVFVPQLYLKKAYLVYFLLAIVLLVVIYFLQPYDRLLRLHMPANAMNRLPPLHDLPPQPPYEVPPHERPFPERRDRHVDIVSVVLFISVWSASMALQIIRQWRQTERRAMQAEAEKVAAELSFLKAQINPHFLFNTLNNIYSLSIVNSEQTPNAILKLSEILHYITDDVHRDFVPLQSEVDCVGNYIELQKLRLTDKVQVQCEAKGDFEGKEIAPLLFMTFIENAFKYGISSHEPCTITIAITAGERSIDFFCRNKILVKAAAEERAGIGIGNAKKRLEFLYRQKHFLNINTENGFFSVHLTILG